MNIHNIIFCTLNTETIIVKVYRKNNYFYNKLKKYDEKLLDLHDTTCTMCIKENFTNLYGGNWLVKIMSSTVA